MPWVSHSEKSPVCFQKVVFRRLRNEKQIVKHYRKLNIAHILGIEKVPALKQSFIYTFQRVWIESLICTEGIQLFKNECSESPLCQKQAQEATSVLSEVLEKT